MLCVSFLQLAAVLAIAHASLCPAGGRFRKAHQPALADGTALMANSTRSNLRGHPRDILGLQP
eukprot:COSAG01_NODE_5304_length_4350_cov_8.058104_3_plen_63_part_00